MSTEKITTEPSTASGSNDGPNLDSVALQRLIDEVRTGEPAMVGGKYDRTHNRHNR